MTELINNSRKRMDALKHLILELHKGAQPEIIRNQVTRMLGEIPYGEVMQVEQELINEGLPQEEILRLCDIHTLTLKGQIDSSAAKIPPAGHPVHTFLEENRAVEKVLAGLNDLYRQLAALSEKDNPSALLGKIHVLFNDLMDVEKHYRRKEYLLFPYMEKHGILGPPKVMWGKHDQTRALLKSVKESLAAATGIGAEEAKALVQLIFRPACVSIEEMIYKEEKILFPMSLDLFSNAEWTSIDEQSPEIGFCLYDPKVKWLPEDGVVHEEEFVEGGKIVMPSGSFTLDELTTMLNTLPVDITFVDKDDTVKYFTQGKERIFDRNRAILGRKVQNCHPPDSVHVVNQIVDDFRSGRQDKAEFWITMQGKFLYISYFAMRNEKGEYLGTVELSIDLTHLRKLEGEQRLLSYTETSKGGSHE